MENYENRRDKKTFARICEGKCTPCQEEKEAPRLKLQAMVREVAPKGLEIRLNLSPNVANAVSLPSGDCQCFQTVLVECSKVARWADIAEAAAGCLRKVQWLQGGCSRQGDRQLRVADIREWPARNPRNLNGCKHLG
jgi:hypothetical protein